MDSLDKLEAAMMRQLDESTLEIVSRCSVKSSVQLTASPSLPENYIEDMRESDDDNHDYISDSDISSENDQSSEHSYSIAPNAQPNPIPVVVFKDSQDTKPNGSKQDWKMFMSSNINNISIEKSTSPKQQEQEQVDVRNDLELKKLLESSKLLEEYKYFEAGTNMHYLHDKYETKKIKAPINIRIGIERKAKERTAKRIQEAKDMGLYNATTKHLYKDERTKHKEQAKIKSQKYDRGLTASIGKYKNGVLHISKRDIQARTVSSKRTGSVGNKVFNAMGGDHRKSGGSKRSKKKK